VSPLKLIILYFILKMDTKHEHRTSLLLFLKQASTITLSKDKPPIPDIITTAKFNENLRIKAKMMRAGVPPPHRVNFSLSDPAKKCNGGMAKPPAPLTSTFNQAAEVPVPVIKTDLRVKIN
jgi:hypothetical protein